MGAILEEFGVEWSDHFEGGDFEMQRKEKESCRERDGSFQLATLKSGIFFICYGVPWFSRLGGNDVDLGSWPDLVEILT